MNIIYKAKNADGSDGAKLYELKKNFKKNHIPLSLCKKNLRKTNGFI